MPFTVAVLDTTEGTQQSEAAANEDECQALRDDSRSLSKSLEHKSLGTLRRRGTSSWSMEDDSESSGWIRSQVGPRVTSAIVIQQVSLPIRTFMAHTRPEHYCSICKQLCEQLRCSHFTLEHSMHPALHGSSHINNPFVHVQLHQLPSLETIPAESPTDIESNSSLSEDGVESLPGGAYAKPSAPR